MSPVTHLLVVWVGLERLQASHRDRALVALAGLAPDLDGLGIVVDFATRMLGMPETDYYQSLHRMYGHGLPAALVIAALAGWLGTRHLATAGWAFLSVHLHFLCDLLGSRGNGPEDFWGIYYLAPISTAREWLWEGQWPLVGWQNMLVTAVLLAIALLRAIRTGYSPLRMFSARGDAVLVGVLRRWNARAVFGDQWGGRTK